MHVDTSTNRWQRNARYMGLVVSDCLRLLNDCLLSDQGPSTACDAMPLEGTSTVSHTMMLWLLQVAKKGLTDTKEACWSYYVQKCRNNLHVVLAMSPVGETLRTRCRNFPGMVNNTVIDWFEPWPEQALQSVATAFLKVMIDAWGWRLVSICNIMHLLKKPAEGWQSSQTGGSVALEHKIFLLRLTDCIQT